MAYSDMTEGLAKEGILALNKELEAPPLPETADKPPAPSRGTKELMAVLRSIGSPNVGMRPAPPVSPSKESKE